MRRLLFLVAIMALLAGCAGPMNAWNIAPGTSREQVLAQAGQPRRIVPSPREFERIEPGKWTREDVEREFGPPAWVDGVASWHGSVMTYRWMEGGDGRMFYWVYLDPQGLVRRAHPGMEFINAPDERK